MPVRYNFGSGSKRVKGFINVDVLDWYSYTDILWDLTKTPYEFIKEPVDEIIAIELLEYISFRDIVNVLKEWYRILRLGGKLSIQVSDIGKMCEYYVKGQICDCVPHKATKMEDFRANPDCWTCRGKAKIHPARWVMAFTGNQKHFPHDLRKNVFTKEILESNLKKAGFRKIEFKPNIYKLVVVAFK